MQQEKTIWKILTLIVGVIGIASSFFFHYDTKRSTENNIVEALSERYESVDKEMSYEQALEAVDKEIKKLKLTNSRLQSKNTNLQQKVSSLQNVNERSDKIAQAEPYASQGNYEVAIPLLNSIVDKTDDVIALLNDYTVKYETSIVADAEKLAAKGKFDEALTIIDDALEILPNSQLLVDKKENITPKYLVETIDCFKGENLWLLDSKEFIKMGGKSYRHAIFSESADLGVSFFNNAYTASAYYNLDGKYSQLKGIVGHIDFSGDGTIGENDAGQVYDVEISIWGDDEEKSTITLTSNDTVKDFNFSVAGINILEFRVKCNGNSKVGIAEIQIR